MPEYRSEGIPPISQVDQMETKRPWGITQKTLYLAEFCLKMDFARQTTPHLPLRVQEYYQLYEPNQRHEEQN